MEKKKIKKITVKTRSLYGGTPRPEIDHERLARAYIENWGNDDLPEWLIEKWMYTPPPIKNKQ
ncbi:MAG: hypothetical protein J5706_06795 [Elusimicrobiales bacterium]|nr:hypothetical protein [Elusimicrobiales bacterium]